VRDAPLGFGLDEWFVNALVGLSGLPPIRHRWLRRPGLRHRGAAHWTACAISRRPAPGSGSWVESRVDSRCPDDPGWILIHAGHPPAFTPPQLLAGQGQ